MKGLVTHIEGERTPSTDFDVEGPEDFDDEGSADLVNETPTDFDDEGPGSSLSFVSCSHQRISRWN